MINIILYLLAGALSYITYGVAYPGDADFLMFLGLIFMWPIFWLAIALVSIMVGLNSMSDFIRGLLKRS